MWAYVTGRRSPLQAEFCPGAVLVWDEVCSRGDPQEDVKLGTTEKAKSIAAQLDSGIEIR
jgi:hypothetical protein